MELTEEDQCRRALLSATRHLRRAEKLANGIGRDSTAQDISDLAVEVCRVMYRLPGARVRTGAPPRHCA